MLAAQARSIPNQNQIRDQHDIPVSNERDSSLDRRQPEQILSVDSRSTKTSHGRDKRMPVPDPMPTSLPKSKDEPSHVRMSQREFQEALQKRSMEKQRRQPGAGGSNGHEEPDVLVGPFHARSQEEVDLKKKEFAEKSKSNNREAVRRWAIEQVQSRGANHGHDDDLIGAQSDHTRDSISSDPSVRDSRPSNGHSNDQVDPQQRWRRYSYDEDLLEIKQSGVQREEEAEEESYSNWLKRQTEAEQTCFVGNEELSCYPTAGTEVVQDRWSKFIWNKNYPRFAQIGFVDVYLFRQDQDAVQTSWTSLNNNEGRLAFSPTDSYWEGRPRADNIDPGQNITWPFYFVITYAGAGLSGTTDRQSTWSAIQTALPVAVASSRSAASASSSLSAASASSASVAATATSTLTGAAASSASASDASVSSSIVASLSRSLVSELQSSGLTGTETLQGTLTTTLADGQVITATATGGSLSDADDNGGGGLPKYAIALIVVFGFLALVAALIGLYFLMAAMRRRRYRNDSTMGSTSPMMRDGIPSSIAPSLDAGAAGGAAGLAGAGLLGTNRSVRSNEDDQLFTSDEATRMADAFRAALRKPEFASPFGSNNQSGDDVDEDDDHNEREDDSPGVNEGSKGNELLRSELASEGRDLRPVQNRGRAELHGED